MNYPEMIKEIGRGIKGAKSLSRDQAQALFGAMLDGTVPDLELGAMVLALRIKGESLEELLGFKAALDVRTPQLQFESGNKLVVLPTYNGARRQANLTPLLALLLARHRVPVLFQGRHDFETRVSPFELLARFSIVPAANLDQAYVDLNQGKVACLLLDDYLPGLAHLLALRPRLGVRGTAHTLAKLIDPARNHSVRVVAVTHPEYLERLQPFLVEDGGAALLMRGTEGEAFANPRRRPQMMAIINQQHQLAWAQEEGGAPPIQEWDDSPALDQNTRLIEQMLAGELAIPEPIRAQAATLLYLAGAAPTQEAALASL
jgi:anthranilate phosphoribosyltransferase